jgi:N-hydroxyarylamine O-acetyltransferase
MNLAKYFERINLSTPVKQSEEGLRLLQNTQITQIPFENIDCFHHRTIHLDIENLEKKIITNQRGGYCFELNSLLLNALTELKFEVRPLLGRVMYRNNGINARTHVVLLITINGKEFLADVGFGGPGYYSPLPFEIGREDVQPHGTFRVICDEIHGYLAQKKIEKGWLTLYCFNRDFVFPADFALSNFYTSQYPESHFRHSLIMALHLPNGRYTLLNKTFTSVIDRQTTIQEIASQEDLLKILREKFKIKTEPEFHFERLFS